MLLPPPPPPALPDKGRRRRRRKKKKRWGRGEQHQTFPDFQLLVSQCRRVEEEEEKKKEKTNKTCSNQSNSCGSIRKMASQFDTYNQEISNSTQMLWIATLTSFVNNHLKLHGSWLDFISTEVQRPLSSAFSLRFWHMLLFAFEKNQDRSEFVCMSSQTAVDSSEWTTTSIPIQHVDDEVRSQ